MEIFYHLSNDYFAPGIIEVRHEWVLHRINNILYRLSAAYAALRTELMHRARRNFATERLRGLHERYRDNVEAMVQVAQARGIIPVIVKQTLDLGYVSTTDGRYSGFVEIYEQSLRSLDEIAEKYDVPIINAADILLYGKTPAERKKLFYDVVHLTAQGNAELAGIIYDRLVELQLKTQNYKK